MNTLPTNNKANKGIRCKNLITGKIVYAYHVESCGAAHNKAFSFCIGNIPELLIPI